MVQGPTVDDVCEMVARHHQQTFGSGPVDGGSLAAVGLTVALWRNGLMEHLHAGFAGRDAMVWAAHDQRLRAAIGWGPASTETGIPDPTMLQLNLATFVAVRDIVQTDGIDVAALERVLLDPGRPFVIDGHQIAAAALFGPFWNDLHADLAGRLERLRARQSQLGDDVTRKAAELFADGYAAHWFGTPWWSDGIERVAANGHVPPHVDLKVLRDQPDQLGTRGFRWLSWNSHVGRAMNDASRVWHAARLGGQDPPALWTPQYAALLVG